MILAIWILFSLLEGIRDALTFQKGTAHYMTQQGINLHPFLLTYRLFFFVVLLFMCWGFGKSLFLGVSLPFLFPFFHEGIYYVLRKKIDSPIGYPNTLLGAWFYASTTTTAKINFNGLLRTIFLLIGLGIYYYVEIYL